MKTDYIQHEKVKNTRSFYPHASFVLFLFFTLHKILHNVFNITEICGKKEKHLLLKYKKSAEVQKAKCPPNINVSEESQTWTTGLCFLVALMF